MADPDLSTPAIQRITRDCLRKALADAGDDCGVTIGAGHLRLVLDLLDASDAALASAPPAPSTGEGEDDLSLFRQAVAAGRFRIRAKNRLPDADPDAGMVWPIEIELPCINGLSCWFTVGNLYTPDAAARGYTDGALNDDLAQALARHIVRSLSPVPGDAEDLIEAVAEQLWLDTFGPDARKNWLGCVREAEEYGPESAAAMQVYQWRARAKRFADAIRPWLTQAVAEHPSDERAAWIIRKAAARIEQLQFSEAVRDVLAERQRQVEAEGWTPCHDDLHRLGEMAWAAAAYAESASRQHPTPTPPGTWPWRRDEWKPGNPRRNLVKAGALILAEIERLDRAAAAELGPNSGGPDGRPS